MRAVLEGSHELAPGVRQFDFSVPELPSLDFTAGQFVSFSQDIGDRNITRAYSICSAPGGGGDNGSSFSLCLNLVPDGRFSPFLFAMKPGDSVAMQGPLGTFTLRDPLRDMIWVATGTGIAPFRSMFYAWDEGPRPHGRVTLVHGARYEEGLLYHDFFHQAAGLRPDFNFLPTLSRPTTEWTGRAGHVQRHVLEAIGDRRDLHIYICGLKAMVDDLRAQLKALGFDRKQIIHEKFD